MEGKMRLHNIAKWNNNEIKLHNFVHKYIVWVKSIKLGSQISILLKKKNSKFSNVQVNFVLQLVLNVCSIKKNHR